MRRVADYIGAGTTVLVLMAIAALLVMAGFK